jgi:CHRD domain
MRKLLAVALVGAGAAGAVPALAGSNDEFEARLSSRAEVPRNSSEAKGEAEFTIARSGRSIAYRLEAEDLSGRVQAAHVHFGRTGQAGPVILNICTRPCSLPRSGRLTRRNFVRAEGVRNFTAALRQLRAGRTYVNLHTRRYAAGEIRGQIRRKR